MSKVSLVACRSYDINEVSSAVKKSLDLLGGIGKYVKPGMKVLLKPNLLSERPPEDAVDTHPEVVRAIGRLVKEAGGVVWVGDSPGGYGKNIDEIFEKSGIKHVAIEEGFELVKFNTAQLVDGIPIAKQFFEADIVISIPKLKTHCITVMTGAIKNTFGMAVGLFKAQCHSHSPKEEDIAKILVKVHSLARAHLTIVDGVIGMEGDGPSGGMPRAIGVIMAGEDPVAIDVCIAKIMGLKPFDITLIKTAYDSGLGEADLGKIEILGAPLKDFVTKDFKLAQTTPLKIIPKSILKVFMSFVKFKPWINISICKKCNLCKITCPVDAIFIGKEDCRIDYKKCVRCLCCHEVCPYKAIGIKRNFLTKLVWG